MHADVSLQPVQPGEAEVVFRAWGSNATNFRFLTAKFHSTVDDSERCIQNCFANPRSLAFHVVVPGSTGVVGLVKALVDGHRAQVGYVIDSDHWRRGYATLPL